MALMVSLCLHLFLEFEDTLLGPRKSFLPWEALPEMLQLQETSPLGLKFHFFLSLS